MTSTTAIPDSAWRRVPARPGPGAETFCLADTLARAALAHGDTPALVSLGETVTYAALLAQLRAIAHAVTIATPPGAAVATLLPHSPAGIAAILGCLVAGRLCIPLNAGEPPERLALLLEDAAPALILAASSASAIPLLNPATLPPAPATWQPPRTHPDSPAIVHFTSGSSGRPKGIVMSHYAVLHRALHNIADISLVPADRTLATTAPSIGSGLGFVLAALTAGATSLVVNIAAEGANAVLRLAARERVTVLVGSVSIIRTLAGLPAAPAAFAALRHLRCGAMGLPVADVLAWRARLPPDCAISHTYASTEAGVIASWIIPRGADDPTPSRSDMPTVAAGTIAPGQEYALLDESGRPAPEFAPGEMVLRDRHIALGEWRQGRLHPGRMTADPIRPQQRIFRTGDIMRLDPTPLDPAPLLRFVARADRQIKVNGVRIEPAEIEAVLRRTEGVTDAAVVVDETGRLVAFVAAAHTGTLRATLAAHLRASLPAALRPARITVLPALPLLPSGKPDLQALRARVATQEQASAAGGSLNLPAS